MFYILQLSNRKGKKFRVKTPSGKWIHFGAIGMDDYTKHRDNKRKQSYIARHSGIKLTNGTFAVKNMDSPAFWSLNLLWNKPTLKKSAEDVEKKHKIKIQLDI
jgi:hypothetical protein